MVGYCLIHYGAGKGVYTFLLSLINENENNKKEEGKDVKDETNDPTNI